MVVSRRPRFIPARAGNTHGFASGFRALSVHPRTSGEHTIPSTCRRAIGGSSPHERGTRQYSYCRTAVRRFIPARAGNTRARLGRSGIARVHPRTSGEHLARSVQTFFLRGSSPHERGTLSHSSHKPAVVRFIPARAGNTEVTAYRTHRVSVHPRTSGEHTNSNLLIGRGNSSQFRCTEKN